MRERPTAPVPSRPAVRGASPLLAGLLVASGLAAPGCGKLMSPPPRPQVDGYQATVTLKAGSTVTARFEIAVRGEAVRRSLGEPDAGGPYLVRSSGKAPVLEVDPSARTVREVPAARLLAGLADVPLQPGFNHAAEAARRGVKEYHRESDGIFAGLACNVWRFEEMPGAINSPSTTYWVAPGLDNLVIRTERRLPRDDGSEERTFVELTSIRAGAPEELFRVPEGYRDRGERRRPRAVTRAGAGCGGRRACVSEADMILGSEGPAGTRRPQRRPARR